MALYVVQVPDPPPGADWSYSVPGEYLERITGITATLATRPIPPATIIDYGGAGNNGSYFNPGNVYELAGLVAGDTAAACVSGPTNYIAEVTVTLGFLVGGPFWINLWTTQPPVPGSSPAFVAFLAATTSTFFTTSTTGAPAGQAYMILQWSNAGVSFAANALDTWTPGPHMCTVTLDLAAKTVTFYLDGAPFGVPYVYVSPDPGDDAINGARIGGRNVGTNVYDEMAWGAGVPTAADIANLYAQRFDFTNYEIAQFALGTRLWAYYHFNEPYTFAGHEVALVVAADTTRVALIPTGFVESTARGPYAYSWIPGLGNAAETPDGTIVTVPTPPLILPAGYALGTDTLDIAPTDQWSNITIWWDSNIMDARAGQSAYLFPPPVHLVYHQEPH